jgi:hypothetical protein
MKPFTIMLISLFFAVLANLAPAAAPMPGEAGRAAQSWLELVDAGEYGRSWEISSAYFRTAVSEANWIASVQAARKPLGARIHREQIDSQEATSLPGAPDGEYRILLFTAEFAGKKAAHETITLMREPDGQWRVAGYFIQ